MVGSVRSCCVPKCGKIRSDKIVLHAFPDPVKEKDRFSTWINAVGSSISSLDHKLIFKNRKICHNHFEEKYLTWTRRLSCGAVPTLHMPDDVSGDHGRSSLTPLCDKKASNTVDSNIDLNPAVSHDVDIELDATFPQSIDTESDSEVPDTTTPFTWQKPSEVIVSDDEDDELRKRKTERENVLYGNNKHLTPHTREFDIRRESELQLDGSEERDQLHYQNYKCNVCSGLIHGFRYRCVQCADYDLCAACETRGAHERHYVLRIPGPRPYAEIENVLNRIRKELLDMNNTVLVEDTDMLDSLKEEVEDELEDPLNESQSSENHIVAANNLDVVHEDARLESDTHVQSTAEEGRRQENYNIALENNNATKDNDNITQANDVTHEVGKENNNTHNISRSVLTKSDLKIINITSLKRKMNESPIKLPIINISNIQQLLDSKKIRILPATAKKLPNNVSSVQPRLDSNQISLLPASAKQLPDNISSTQQHVDSNKTSILPTSTTRPKKSVVMMKMPQKSLASDPSNITNNNLSTSTDNQ